MNKKAILFAVPLLFALPMGAQAACTRADFTGAWIVYLHIGAPVRCTLVMPNSGNRLAASSSCFSPAVAFPVAVSGTLNINTACRVSGSLSAAGYTVNVDAWISSGKDSISGMGWNPNDTSEGGGFSGVKR